MKFRRDGCQEFVKTMSFHENNCASFVRNGRVEVLRHILPGDHRAGQRLPRWISEVQAICQKSWARLNGISGLKPQLTLAR
jgi:hypothetical protein